MTCPKRLTFSGSCEKDWRNFELDFRHWMQLENIQLGSMKMFALGDALTGRAREHFNCVRMELNSFESIMDAMRMKFEKDRMELADTALVQLKMVQQQEKESYEEFEDRVSLLVYRAFPNSSDGERIRQSVIAFTQGVADRNLKKDLMKMYLRNMQEVKAYVVRYQHAQETCKFNQNSWKGGYGRKSEIRNEIRRLFTFSDEEDEEPGNNVKSVSFAPGTKEENRRSNVENLNERVGKLEEHMKENSAYQRDFKSQLNRLENLLKSQRMSNSPWGSPRGGSPRRSPQKPGSPDYTGCNICGHKDHFAKDCPN